MTFRDLTEIYKDQWQTLSNNRNNIKNFDIFKEKIQLSPHKLPRRLEV